MRAPEEQETAFDQAAEVDSIRRQASEDDLRKVIYGIDGRDSLFEQVGQALYAAVPQKGQQSLSYVFGNALYFTFRLLFIAYFEDRHWAALQAHSHYPRLSLRTLYKNLAHAAKFWRAATQAAGLCGGVAGRHGRTLTGGASVFGDVHAGLQPFSFNA